MSLTDYLPSAADEYYEFAFGATVATLFEFASNIDFFNDGNSAMCWDALGEGAISISSVSAYWYSFALSDEEEIYNIFLSVPSVFHLYWALFKYLIYCKQTVDPEEVNFFNDPNAYDG